MKKQLAVSFYSDGIQLQGTLTLPEGVAQPPVFLFLHGSFPQTRDGNADITKRRWFPQPLPQNNLFEVEANLLAQAGIASLRYDKRGCGHSEGDFDRARMLDFLADARAAIAWLQQCSDVDMNRFGIVGHNEGALLASIIAAEDHLVSYLILQSARYTDVQNLLTNQSSALKQNPPSVLETIEQYNPFIYWIYQDHERLMERLLAGDELYQLGDDKWSVEVYLPWLRDHMEHVPAQYLARIHCPVLVLHSRLDDRVHFTEAIQTSNALEAAKATVTLKILDGLDADFRQIDFVGASEGLVNTDRTQTQEFCQTLRQWLEQVVTQQPAQ